jgi:hypothetical protein
MKLEIGHWAAVGQFANARLCLSLRVCMQAPWFKCEFYARPHEDDVACLPVGQTNKKLRRCKGFGFQLLRLSASLLRYISHTKCHPASTDFSDLSQLHIFSIHIRTGRALLSSFIATHTKCLLLKVDPGRSTIRSSRTILWTSGLMARFCFILVCWPLNAASRIYTNHSLDRHLVHEVTSPV